MSKIPVLNAVRIIPREADYLDRKSGSRGEIFFDNDSNTLRLYTGVTTGGIQLAKGDLSNVTNSDFATKASAAGIGGGAVGNFELTVAADDSTARIITSGNTLQFVGGDGISTTSAADGTLTITSNQPAFGTISVDGQSDVVAVGIDDTLTFEAGNNVVLTTDPSTKKVTISASAGASTNSFATISVTGQNNVVADSGTSTLTLAAGSGITITTNSGTDTVTFNNNGPTTFAALTDVNTTIDRISYPAITMLDVTNVGASAYTFSQYTGNNPTIYAINRTTIAFNLDVEGHPFLIQTGVGVNYDTGLIHVATNGTVSTGSNAQGKTSGTLYWRIPDSISGGYRYQCGVHAGMVGSISIRDFVAI